MSIITLRRAVTVAAAGVLLLTLLVVVADPFGGNDATSTGAVPTGFARIVRTNVVERQQVAGTLDYSGSFTVAYAGSGGVLTWLPAPGAIVRRGRSLFEVDHQAVRLLYGPRPAYRDLALGAGAGADVRELQLNLRALGFDAGGALVVDGRFDTATLAAVEQWQRSLGQLVTGDLPLGSVVFLPAGVRVAQLEAAAGATLQAGAAVLSGTSTRPAVLVPLDPGSVSRLAPGDPALVTMPDGTVLHGAVATIGRVASAATSDSGASPDGGQGSTTPTVPVTITLDDPHTSGGLDQAPVQVGIVEQEARHALAAPVSALLAQPDGGYAIRVASGPSTRLVAVTTGLFDEVAGRVEISGPRLAAGMRVEVPSG
jgi:peptidoglycan hydrolase-like protein with peptidoglycan-binding domain